MYGGLIFGDMDRVLNALMLDHLVCPEILENKEMTFAKGFKSPNPKNLNRDDYIKYIEKFPEETPEMFGLHSKIEIGYLDSLGE